MGRIIPASGGSSPACLLGPAALPAVFPRDFPDAFDAQALDPRLVTALAQPAGEAAQFVFVHDNILNCFGYAIKCYNRFEYENRKTETRPGWPNHIRTEVGVCNSSFAQGSLHLTVRMAGR
jgi:hypothetical protein